MNRECHLMFIGGNQEGREIVWNYAPPEIRFPIYVDFNYGQMWSEIYPSMKIEVYKRYKDTFVYDFVGITQ